MLHTAQPWVGSTSRSSTPPAMGPRRHGKTDHCARSDCSNTILFALVTERERGNRPQCRPVGTKSRAGSSRLTTCVKRPEPSQSAKPYSSGMEVQVTAETAPRAGDSSSPRN